MHLVERLKLVSNERHDAVAVVHGNQRTTYAEIGQLTANVSAHLLDEDISKGDRVAILLTNSANYIAVFYGIWAAGGVTVALNTQAKARDVVNWIRHSGAKWLFVDTKHPEAPQVAEALGTEIRLISVHTEDKPEDKQTDSDWLAICKAKQAFPEVDIRSNDLASIIYTSGTTGHPKGVTLSHGNLTTNIDSILDYLNINQSDSIVNVLPFYYSYSNSILHTHIAVGAKLVLENSMIYPHKVIERISEEQVTGFYGVPSTFSLILGRVKLENYDLSCLRYLTQAGGPMPPAITDKLLDALPDVELFIMYEQTEAPARLSYLPSHQVKEKRGSIGIPIPRVTLEIRDKSGAVTPTGVTGEICAKGH
jgi:acyl-CoA synthetase (AMP-forming)/AMP-acid ligase II